MIKRTSLPRLVDISDAIDSAQDILGGADFGTYEKSAITRLAIERCLEIISEASRHLPDELTAQFPHIPWSEIRGIGNVLRHEYFDVQNLVIWRTARNELPKLKPVIQAMIDQVNKQA